MPQKQLYGRLKDAEIEQRSERRSYFWQSTLMHHGIECRKRARYGDFVCRDTTSGLSTSLRWGRGGDPVCRADVEIPSSNSQYGGEKESRLPHA